MSENRADTRRESGRRKRTLHAVDDVPSGSSRSNNNETRLARTYSTLSLPGSFGGINILQRYTGEPIAKIKDFLTSQDAYTLHKPIVSKFKRRRVFSTGPLDLFQADLVDMTNISRYNDHYRFILTVIDVFTKRAYVMPLMSKSSRDVTDAFEKILPQSGICRMLNTDRGVEFLNARFQEMLKKYNIHFYTTNDPTTKIACAERFNRTFKSKLFKYFTHNNTRRYLGVLDQLMKSYNNTYHSSIKMSPNQVNDATEDLVRERLYPPKPNKKPRFRFDIGDAVRITKARSPFAKSYEEGGWSEEIFFVENRHSTFPVTYSIRDYNQETIKGKFYADELSKVTRRRGDEMFKVEEILKTKRTPDGKIKYFVKWYGYSNDFNSWTDEIKSIARV